MKKLPIVAIVGRANVGKSSLFNAVVGAREAVVAKEAGTTRDAVYRQVDVEQQSFWLVDTAGLKAPEDEFEATIQDQIEQASTSADVIAVVVDGATQISDEDRRVAKTALKSKKPVILVVNKIDSAKKNPEKWERLGIKSVVKTSVTQRQGIDDFEDTILSLIPKVKGEQRDSLVLALIGRPNVGKSYMFNTLAKKQQAIVADIAGTTRDVNRAKINYKEQSIEILDTAGIRRSGRIEVGIEKFSVLRTLAAIEESDVCVLVMDAHELNTKLDQKIAGMVKDAGKGLIIAVSKWDAVEKDEFTRDAMAPRIGAEFQFVNWAPLIFTSSVTGKNISKLFELSMDIYQARQKTVKTTELNKWLRSCVASHPPAGLKNTYPKLRYITQTDSNPPAFKVFGTDVEFLHWSYKRYLDRELRQEFGFHGTSVKFYFANN